MTPLRKKMFEVLRAKNLPLETQEKYVAEIATVNEKMDYSKLFSYPMCAALACLVFMLALYPNRPPAIKTGDADADTSSEDDRAEEN